MEDEDEHLIVANSVDLSIVEARTPSGQDVLGIRLFMGADTLSGRAYFLTAAQAGWLRERLTDALLLEGTMTHD